MIKKICKCLVIAFSFVIIFSTVAFADTMSTTKKQVDGYTVSLAFDQNPIKIGNNDFKIVVMDSNEQPVSDAQITTTFDMDRSKMDTMGMDEPVVVTLKEGESGEYTGTVNLTKKGDWKAKTEFKIQDQTKNTQFDFSVITTGPNWIVIGGFIGFIVLVIIIAFIIKTRNKKTLNA